MVELTYGAVLAATTGVADEARFRANSSVRRRPNPSARERAGVATPAAAMPTAAAAAAASRLQHRRKVS